MNDSKNSSKGLLVLRMGRHLTDKETQALMNHITPTADRLGVEPMVLPPGADIQLQMDSSALLERVCEALEEIAAQGRAPEVSEAQIAPQALNPRQQPYAGSMEDAVYCVTPTPRGLNTR